VNVLQTLVEPAAQAGITLEIIPVPKGIEAKDESTKLLEFVRGAAGAVGGLPKLKQKGPLHDKFQDMLAQSDIVLEDAALFFAHLLAIYDLPSALQSAKKSGFLTGSVCCWPCRITPGVWMLCVCDGPAVDSQLPHASCARL
jgi:hypothetical protein